MLHIFVVFEIISNTNVSIVQQSQSNFFRFLTGVNSMFMFLEKNTFFLVYFLLYFYSQTSVPLTVRLTKYTFFSLIRLINDSFSPSSGSLSRGPLRPEASERLDGKLLQCSAACGGHGPSLERHLTDHTLSD